MDLANDNRPLLTRRGNSKRRQLSWSKVLRLGVFMVAIAAAGCQDRCNRGVIDASKDLALNITKTSGPLPTTKSKTAADERRVYIDASISMKGFVNAQNHSTFDELIDELGDVLPGCRLYKYGQRGSQPPENSSELMTLVGFGSELHEASFYSLSYNPDDRLINDLASESSAGHSVLSVLLTDGVYSEPEGSTSPPVVASIEKWMANGNMFGVLMFQSAFNGPLYSERRRTLLPILAVEQRPFYAFVFSPTAQAFFDLRDRLKRRFGDLNTIVFSPDGVTTTVALPPKTGALYTNENPPSTPYYWQMFDSALFSGKSSASLTYQLKYSVSPEYPVAQFTTTLTPEYYRWQRAQFKKSDTGPPQGFRFQIDRPRQDNESVRLTVNLPKDLSSDYGFYSFKLNSSANEVRSYIREVSTRDDSTPANANKTYRFHELIAAIADIHFKNNLATRTSPPLFVTIGNR